MTDKNDIIEFYLKNEPEIKEYLNAHTVHLEEPKKLFSDYPAIFQDKLLELRKSLLSHYLSQYFQDYELILLTIDEEIVKILKQY